MPFLNPNLGINFTNYIADRTRNFIGRKWMFRAIYEWLSDPDGSRYWEHPTCVKIVKWQADR